MYHHKSGALKRKERAERDAKATAQQRTLGNFGFTSKPPNGRFCTADQETTAPENSVQNEPDTSDSDNSAVEDSTVIAPTCSDTETRSTAVLDVPLAIEPAITDSIATKDNDIGLLADSLTTEQVEVAVRRGPDKHPYQFPCDNTGRSFPSSVLRAKLQNGEITPRDWLVWSIAKQSLYCFPCRLFSKLPQATRSNLASAHGHSVSDGWKKLYDKIPEHERSSSHKQCYMQWRQLQKSMAEGSTIDALMLENMKSNMDMWKQILHRILDVTLFLGERGLAFRGNSQIVGDHRNGNFLGILELIGRYDPVIGNHLEKVKKSQTAHERLQAHYLSADSQNEFITCCAQKVLDVILHEVESAKYYSIIVDATPDSAHIEQTVFILRYVHLNADLDTFEVHERFLAFVDCNKKTGKDIAELIIGTLKKHSIPLTKCRGQGYDNGSNMSGSYKGAQAIILKDNPFAMFSPCGCHSLNLCGVHSAECCAQVITFFGVVQKLYNLFSSSPQRWQILTSSIGCSLHNPSQTRWSARVDSVKPFAAHLPGIMSALTQVQGLNLTPETRSDVAGTISYLSSFESVLMASIWLKILTAINFRNLLLQAREATLDIEVANIRDLIDDLKVLRSKWEEILSECKLVAERCGVEQSLRLAETKRKRRRRLPDRTVLIDDDQPNPQEEFKRSVFYVVIDCIIANLTTRYEAAKNLDELFSVLWKYLDMSTEDVRIAAKRVADKYAIDISADLLNELEHLKTIHVANLGQKSLSPFDLLNRLHALKVESLFPNVVIMLRIFCTLPVTVAQAERSFSTLARVKNVLRSTMCQERLTSLGMLAVECKLARKLDYDSIIELFASRKARKIFL